MIFFHQFKLVDVLVLVLQAVYTAVKYGLLVEAVKDCALVAATFFSFQYYPLLLQKLESEAIKQDQLYFLSFWIIFTSILIIFLIVRKILQLLIRREELSFRERWLSLPLGLARSVLLTSTLVFAAHLLPLTDGFFRDSLSRRVFRPVAPVLYEVSFPIYHKLRPEEEKNKEIIKYYETQKNLSGSHKKRN